MSGRHLKPGRSRFAWEVLRFVLGWALVVALVVSLFWLLQEVLPSVVSGDQTTTTAVTDESTTTTEAAPTTSETTTTVADTTTTTTATTTTTEVPAVRPPGDVTVLVLNSTPRVGLAGSAAARLSDEGYIVATPANATPRRPNTVVLHAEGYGAEAEVVTALFEDEAVFGLDDEGRTTAQIPIVVILGDSYDS